MPAVVRRSYAPKAVRATASGLLAVGALSASACDSKPGGPEQVDPAAFAWNAPISAPATVFVRNANGSVEVRPATDGNVRVTAETRWTRGDPKRDVKFETVNGPNGVTICATWGQGACGSNNFSVSDKLIGRKTDVKVAFTVYVPTGVKVDAFTANGSIGVAATAPVKAQTLNGTIKVATSVGPVDAETMNGDVDVRMTTLGADGPVRAKSVNGSVAAYLPEKFDGAVSMESVLGGLSNDFSAGEIKSGEKKYVATVGAGGRRVELATVTGSAALHRLKADGTVAP